MLGRIRNALRDFFGAVIMVTILLVGILPFLFVVVLATHFILRLLG